MKKLALRLLMLTPLLGMSWSTQAVPIVTSAFRGVAVADNVNTFFGPNTSFTGTGLFQDTITKVLGSNSPQDTTADQNSNIDAALGLISGSGSGGIGFSVLDTDGVSAQSILQVAFSLLTDHNFILAGLLDASADGGFAHAGFGLVGPDSANTVATSGPVDLASNGILHAGDYELTVFATMEPQNPQPGSFMGGNASFNFTLNLTDIPTQVPEPTTLALFAVGLAGVRFRTRRAAI